MSAKSDIVQTTTNPTPSTILAGFAEKRGLTLEAVRQALVCGPCAGIETAAHTDALYETIVARAEMLGADPLRLLRPGRSGRLHDLRWLSEDGQRSSSDGWG